jgi:hypothetical protein
MEVANPIVPQTYGNSPTIFLPLTVQEYQMHSGVMFKDDIGDNLARSLE